MSKKINSKFSERVVRFCDPECEGHKRVVYFCDKYKVMLDRLYNDVISCNECIARDDRFPDISETVSGGFGGVKTDMSFFKALKRYKVRRV